jgi:hypothetical protein
MSAVTGDSRYASADYENALTHTYDAIGVPEYSDVQSTKLIELSRSTSYVLTTGQASKPPHAYMAKVTDNMQLLAYRVLQDPTRWWVIANGNPHIRYPLDLGMGDMIYLPE